MGILRIGLAQVGAHECGGLRLYEVWINFRARFETLSRKGQIVRGENTAAPTGAIPPEAVCAVAMDKSTSAKLPPAESPVSAIFFIPVSTIPR